MSVTMIYVLTTFYSLFITYLQSDENISANIQSKVCFHKLEENKMRFYSKLSYIVSTVLKLVSSNNSVHFFL